MFIRARNLLEKVWCVGRGCSVCHLSFSFILEIGFWQPQYRRQDCIRFVLQTRYLRQGTSKCSLMVARVSRS